ncbi:MAG TPA: NADH-quinone oxidoreductase subunit H [Bacteroidales bacterium]|nr:NADH-quinone oxidoreductase subunit H [Bacteroidales bacterium]HPS16863.1 NADH-quinone oxidoreductase subunit H [Bacteroidales bacterium]
MSLFYIFIFPGILFLSIYGIILEFVDRKLFARFQNRVGPPWFQPLADFIKLMGKEGIIPTHSDKAMFKILPAFAIAAASVVILYLPIWSTNALYSFDGDLIVVLYLLTIPTVTFFLAGWSSSSLYATIGAVRTITQLFAYEVPLFMSLLGPAILADSWSFSGITEFYCNNPLMALANIPGFIVAIIAIQGKLERTPFDIPDAETEIVAGPFTEYSGRFLAFFRMSLDIEMIIGASIIAAVFLPFWSTNIWFGLLIYLVKTLLVVFILSLLRALMARIRIEQMVNFCWKFLAPLAILQILIDIIVKVLI